MHHRAALWLTSVTESSVALPPRPGWESPAVKTENDAHRYCSEAAECELNAENATNRADREAWKCLADDWMKLARAAEANPFIETFRF
jgi:hypothetical protein